MRVIADDLAPVKDEDSVRIAQEREPMRHDDHGPAFDDARHVVLNDHLAFRVEGARRLVQDQDARPSIRRALS